MKVPTLVVGGEHTARYFALINEVVVRCIPGSRPLIISQATHRINRLKMLKRQMFGRARLDLLARRFLLAA